MATDRSSVTPGGRAGEVHRRGPTSKKRTLQDRSAWRLRSVVQRGPRTARWSLAVMSHTATVKAEERLTQLIFSVMHAAVLRVRTELRPAVAHTGPAACCGRRGRGLGRMPDEQDRSVLRMVDDQVHVRPSRCRPAWVVLRPLCAWRRPTCRLGCGHGRTITDRIALSMCPPLALTGGPR